MKTAFRFIVLSFITILVISSCQNKDIDTNSFKLERERVVPSVDNVSITGSYSFAGTVKGMKVNIGEQENLSDANSYPLELDGTEFSITINNLKPSTRYYYNYNVDFGTNDALLTETKNFTTLDVVAETPTVKALEVLAIDSTTFRIKCEVIADGGSEVTQRGICWNTYGDPTMDDETMQHADGGLGIYTIRMEHLALGKHYYVRAYAKNAAGKIGWSEEVLDFETEAPAGASVVIELGCNPEQGGTVSGGGTYEVGTQCTVTATTNAGYTFINWTENGEQVSSEAVYTFAVTTGRSLVANFTKQAYVITTEVDPEDSGSVTGAGGYDYGESCTLTATPKTGYDFEKWTKGSSTISTEAEYTFTVNGTATYVAHFKVKSYTVTVSANPSNGGTVTGGGTVNYGQSCTVHATPATGFAFVNWKDDGDVVSTDADYTFTVTSGRSLVANFTELQPDEYSITVSADPSTGGTVAGGGTYTQGATCTVTATSKPGFTFVNWTENGNQVSDLAEYSFTVTGHRTLVAHFEAQAPTTYTVSVSANPSNGGTVSGGGTYEQGQQCTVTATPATGYTFTNWTENGTQVSTNASYTFIVNGNRNLVANFTIKSYTINASAVPSNGGTVSGSGTYTHGQSCTLSATTASGYTFTNWTENGSQVSTNPNYTFTVTGNRTLVAHFQAQAPNTYNINVSANPSAGGTVTGGGTYNQGASCTVTATANTGYTFLRWTENGNQVSTTASYTFTVTGNRTLVAQFQVQSYTISASADPTNGGSVSGGGSYNYGTSCTLTATPASGYSFVNWTKNGNQVSTNASYTFTVTETASYVAHFQIQSYTISASANPSNGGTVTGGGTYNYGTSCTLTANAATGYTFQRWTENGSQVSTNQSYTFTVTGNRTLVANFTAQPQAPTGAINGLFSVSASQQVWFSQGNLQYNANQGAHFCADGSLHIGTWRFATNQWDYVGQANSNISQNYNGWIDLFGWGTSSWDCNVYVQPWDSDNTHAGWYGPPGQYNLTGSYAYSDWGLYNEISNGGNTSNTWRTLTHEEWTYVFNTRNTSSGIRYAKAQVNNVNGIILLPDNWSSSYYTLYDVNQSSVLYSSNMISSSTWTNLLEAHGAVFLPAAGIRNGTSVDGVDNYGYYWSTSYDRNDFAWSISFYDFAFGTDFALERYYGFSLRLVYPAQ